MFDYALCGWHLVRRGLTDIGVRDRSVDREGIGQMVSRYVPVDQTQAYPAVGYAQSRSLLL